MDKSIQGRRHKRQSSGRGTPVILLHGIPTSPALWRHVVPLLKGMRVHNYEMPGYGHSIDVPDGLDLGLSAQAGYLSAWMDDQGIEAAVLVGHDLGGGVAHILASREPGRCLGIVLTNAVGYDSWPIPSVRALGAIGPVTARMPRPLVKALLRNLLRRGHDDAEVPSQRSFRIAYAAP